MRGKIEKIPNTKCLICRKEFYVKPYFLKHGWGKYCSRECQNEGKKTGSVVICAYCGKKVYRTPRQLQRKSKTKTFFCDKSCQCAWKNKQRKGKERFKSLKNLWGSWCNSSIKVCGTFGADANSVDPPLFFKILSRFLKHGTKRINPLFIKRPLKKVLYNLYWRNNHTQTEIAKNFNATHTSVKRWFNYYKIPVKSRALTCGRNLNSIKNLELGKTPEAERKSAEARRIYTKEKLIQIIKVFVEKHGRVPTKNEFVKIRNSSYPNHTTLRDYFGTWNNAIKAASYEPNEQWFAATRVKDLFARDGHKCDSISEIIIDDWLFENNIPHTREYLYPESRYRCDFVVNNIFIEFFGLSDAFTIDIGYGETMKRKKAICKRHNIPLIELYEKDLYNLNQTLGGKLRQKLKQEALF
ncbi:MAG: hypothetical protein AUJ31_02165 [Parcubacteria group bacterium CG1_02_39_15]|uniref:Uncharacterized protein n=4 Tax=Candidatus Nealsoniibacteriota TaxID=1817911 RepID=A0A2G9YT69_9BACT|nr:MAG: hypothetical protein AUJ31_02165 [Parcubacteria group bacterium CG1_02_39_15]PIP22369.1 MAG: hypothetical protein COX38_00990 [Candidatus Nealsonbacteria bacterium CG23_combo_of_CG06-09_8_20_14_all_39_25]PIQ98568.1 MAG: hypothetical protein COV64_00475 [Candidatus Nealsonbacteria bacterium CG11_big_fil_rev_8_21_14_0_20_39_9]PIW90142.1 MAG: hypothetical protein COZ92_01485 [Candidatus Nealsonbacteria bacterium CG_4_8_14_3_um_filter_40_11]PIZ88190.1 MAG: hypothetical protein COX91_01480 [